MNQLTLLGTGTCQIEYARRASSVLLQLDGTPILFDCGHGIVQCLLDAGIDPNRLDHVVISHFHPDHVSDLIPLLHAGAWSRRNPRTTDLHVYGPPGVRAFMDGLFQLFGPSAFRQPSYSVIVHEVTEERFSIGTQHFDFIDLPPAGNHGLRFAINGKTCALSGDSNFHEQEITFLKGVDLAIIDSGHPSNDEIVQLAAASQARILVCSHLYRDLNAEQLQSQASSAGYTGTILVGHDLLSFVI
jgi:ribonuclease BN (tRNA processing enzyme)